MSEELVVVGNTEVQPYVEPYDESGLDDVAKLRPANVILVQNTTRERGSANPGQLLDKLTGEVYDSLVVVPLKVMKQRILFAPGADLDADPLCSSNDGIVPSPYALQPQSRKCATCPQSQWLDGKKSACAEKLRLLVVTKDSGLPRFFTAGGKSIPTLRNVLQRIQEAIRMQDAKIKQAAVKGEPAQERLHLHDFFFEIRGEKVTGKFVFYVARFDNVKRVADPGEFGPAFEEFVIQRKVQTLEEKEVVAEMQTNAVVSQVVQAEFVQQV